MSASTADRFCDAVNSFCEENNIEVKDIKYGNLFDRGIVIFEPKEESGNGYFAKEYCKLKEEYDRMNSAYDSALKEIQNHIDHYKWHPYYELPSKYGEDWVLVRVRDFVSAEVYGKPLIAENRNGVWYSDHDQIFGTDQLPFTVVEWRSIE